MEATQKLYFTILRVFSQPDVWGNDITNPKYDYWSVFRIMREARPESKLAIFSTWEDNRTKLLGERLPQTNHLTLDFVFDGYENDTLAFPHDASRNYESFHGTVSI